MDAQQSPSLSWQGAEKYLADNAKGCLPYLPLLRDGRMCWNASVINTIENGRWETIPTKLELNLTLNSTVDLATITRDSWAKQLTELKNRFPYLSILGRKAAEAELATMPPGSTMGYDASRGFISSIGINLERYREKTLRDPSTALKMEEEEIAAYLEITDFIVSWVSERYRTIPARNVETFVSIKAMYSHFKQSDHFQTLSKRKQRILNESRFREAMQKSEPFKFLYHPPHKVKISDVYNNKDGLINIKSLDEDGHVFATVCNRNLPTVSASVIPTLFTLPMVQSQQTNKKAKLSHGAPIEAPIEEPVEPTVGVPIGPIATGQPATTTRLPTTEFPFKRLTRGDQLESACGTNTELVAYAKDRYGNKPGGMTREQVKRWYKKDMANRLPSRFIGKEFGLNRGDIQVCHIISTANGGHDWVYNYFIDLAEVNHHFGKHISKEWDDYIGKDAKGHAESFSRWAAKKLKGLMPFGTFDPISDYYTARS